MAAHNDLLTLNRTMACISNYKIRAEVSRAEPRLRKLVALTNTLDALTDWTFDYLNRRSLERLHASYNEGGEAGMPDESDVQEGWTCQLDSTTHRNRLQEVEQYVVTTSEVEKSDTKDDDSDDEDSAFSIHMVTEEPRRSHELHKKIEQFEVVDLRPWQGVPIPETKGMNSPYAHLYGDGRDGIDSDSESDSSSDVDSTSDSEDDSEDDYKSDSDSSIRKAEPCELRRC
jgi:hypothetical protein